MVLKMGSVCSMVHCNNYNVQKCARSFHRFPRDKKICAEWVHKCKRLDLDLLFKKRGAQHMNSIYKVCSDHFLASDYNNPNLKSQGLKRFTVPSVNLPSNNLRKAKRKSPRERRDLFTDDNVDAEERRTNTDAPECNSIPRLFETEGESLSTQNSNSSLLGEMSPVPESNFGPSLNDYSVYRVIPVEPIVNIQCSTESVSTMTELSGEDYDRILSENKELKKRISELEKQLTRVKTKGRTSK